MTKKLSPKEAIQQSKEYKELTPYDAVAIAEGFNEGEATEQQQQAAWQYIYDTGMFRHLQGFFGRTLERLIDNGIVFA